MAQLTIGKLAAAADVGIKTVRFHYREPALLIKSAEARRAHSQVKDGGHLYWGVTYIVLSESLNVGFQYGAPVNFIGNENRRVVATSRTNPSSRRSLTKVPLRQRSHTGYR